VSNDKSTSTATAGARFLFAYEVLGDPAYLFVARQTGEFYLQAQDRRGFWHHGYTVSIHGPRPSGSSEKHIKLQDSVQTHPLFFLAYLHRLTEDERYLAAAKKSGEFILHAQNPNGSWSHHFNMVKDIGETHTGLPQGGELNDLAMNDCMDSMLLMHHLTKDAKYVESLLRAGDWLVRSQQRGPTYAWADQYDRDDNPVWAREFEPPGVSLRGSALACRGLLLMYDITADAKYLAPVEKYAEWLKSVRARDKCTYAFYDHNTGRPIAAHKKKIHFIDDAGQLDEIRRLALHQAYFAKGDSKPDRWVTHLDLRKESGPVQRRPPVTVDSLATYSRTTAESVRKILAAQTPEGVWLYPPVAGNLRTSGPVFCVREYGVRTLLRYVEGARTALGELPCAYRGSGALLEGAYPKDDWLVVARPGAK